MPIIIFSKKKEFQIWDFWIIYIMVKISFFWGLLESVFHRQPTMVVDIEKKAITSLYSPTQETLSGDSWKLFRIKILLFFTRGRMFRITSKYFTIFNNTPQESWAAHTASDFFMLRPELHSGLRQTFKMGLSNGVM